MDAPTLYMCKISRSKKIALGYKALSKGFRVLAGSAVRYEGNPEFETSDKGYKSLRDKLIEANIISINKSSKSAVFVQDYTFTSSSAAASVVRGASSNGNDEWEPLNPTDK